METKARNALLVATAVAVLLLLLLLVGWGVAKWDAPSPAETPSASLAPGTDDLPVTAGLLDVYRGLEKTAAHLRKVNPGNKGGHVEKAQVNVATAMELVVTTLNYAGTHPDLSDRPALESGTKIPDTPATNAAINVRRALDAIRAAHDSLQRTPGGDLGGYRQQIDSQIQAAADDMVNAIKAVSSD